MIPPRHVLNIEEIIVKDRQRALDQAHVESLADSIKAQGLIQPIIVNHEKRLIAGAHRLAAHRFLGRHVIDVVFLETLSDDHLAELELTEDVKRLDRTWQERCTAIAKIHALKKKNAALNSARWGERETGDLLNIKGSATIHWSLTIADLINAGDKEIADATSLKGAWDVVMRREEERILADLHAGVGQSLEGPLPGLQGANVGFELLDDNEAAESDAALYKALDAADFSVDEKQHYQDVLDRCKTLGFLSLNESEAATLWGASDKSEPFPEWHARLFSFHSKREQDRHCIPLSSFLHNADCIDYMQAHPASVDHILTDPPYAIDVDNMQQQTGFMANISTIESEHQVEPNRDLLARFFPAAFSCVKEGGFVITWCDEDVRDYMKTLALAAGFKVQRWSIIWCKTGSCGNSCANTNFTKRTEIALVCRKGVATLTRANIPNFIIADNRDDLTDSIEHPFAKPFQCWEHLIDSTTLEGQTILEPFCGGGSGVISLIRMKRRVIGIEKVPEHYHKLIQRVKDEYLSVSPNFNFA